jgi:hypothetical protein
MLACLLANLNSTVFNYFARQKILGIHLNANVLEQLPVLPPDSYGVMLPWQTDRRGLDWIMPRVMELTYTAWELQTFASDCCYNGPPFCWESGRRFVLLCELDAAYFHLYGIARKDVDYIMDTFPIIRRQDEAYYGDYRTKRLILEIYDDIAHSTATGDPYITQLDPPPGDPRAAHPWDEKYLGPHRDLSTWWDDNKWPADDADLAQIAADRREDQEEDQRKSADDQRDQRAKRARFAFTPPQGSRNERRNRVMELSRSTSVEAVGEMVAALTDRDETVRWLASASLAQLGGPTVILALRSFLVSDLAVEPDPRLEAVKVLGRVGDGEVRPVLEEIAADGGEDAAVREAARVALEMLSV